MNSADMNVLAIEAGKGDTTSRNELIELNRGFIRRISSYVCKRNLDWSNDDELSIALLAFNEAIDSYNPDKGAEFLSYSRLLIHSRLIDYFRKNANPHISMDSMGEEELSVIETREAVDRYTISHAAEERVVEIRMFNQELSRYGLSLTDLTSNSPKHRDTRKMLFEIAVKCGGEAGIVKDLRRNKMLPIKDIMLVTGAKRKFLEQWRKYLVALITIASSDEYLYLKEYIDFKGSKAVI
jgi:RNA polymerase sigma factor